MAKVNPLSIEWENDDYNSMSFQPIKSKKPKNWSSKEEIKKKIKKKFKSKDLDL